MPPNEWDSFDGDDVMDDEWMDEWSSSKKLAGGKPPSGEGSASDHHFTTTISLKKQHHSTGTQFFIWLTVCPVAFYIKPTSNIEVVHQYNSGGKQE